MNTRYIYHSKAANHLTFLLRRQSKIQDQSILMVSNYFGMKPNLFLKIAIKDASLKIDF